MNKSLKQWYQRPGRLFALHKSMIILKNNVLFAGIISPPSLQDCPATCSQQEPRPTTSGKRWRRQPTAWRSVESVILCLTHLDVIYRLLLSALCCKLLWRRKSGSHCRSLDLSIGELVVFWHRQRRHEAICKSLSFAVFQLCSLLVLQSLGASYVPFFPYRLSFGWLHSIR